MNPIRSERPVRRPTRSITSLPLAVISLPLLATLAACSSGGTSGTTSPTGTPTISAARVSQGTLADSTGVSVNGTSYTTDSTRFTNDGLPTTRDSLSPGMQVTRFPPDTYLHLAISSRSVDCAPLTARSQRPGSVSRMQTVITMR